MMSKQELIDKQALIEKLLEIPGIGSNSDALEMIKRFPVYKPQKPVVPQFVADWIKDHMDMGKYVCLEIFMCQYNSIDLPTDLYNYYDTDRDGSRDKVINAILYGYEVEKEHSYCVKIGKGYFSGFDETKVTYVLDDAPGSLARRVIYKGKDEAEMDAIQIGGTVEEVAEG